MSDLLPPWSIPEHWEWAFLGDRTEVVGGGTPSTKDQANFDNGNIPWITPADLSSYAKKYISHGQRNITDKGLAGSGARVLPAGTVLFSSRAPIGYVAIASNPMATNQGFKSFVPNPDLVSDYLYYYLKRAKELAIGLSSGTTFPEISGKKARQIPVPVPPVDEQRQIVAEIETQFARLDDAVASLKRARVRLKRYRASVLKAACEGRLVPTEADLARWEVRDYEPASVLLERIRAEREATFQHSGSKKKYAEPVVADVEHWTSSMPNTWIVTSLETLTSAARTIRYGILMPKENVSDGVLYVKVRDFKNDAISLEGLQRTTSEIAKKYQNASLVPGDILLSIRGTYGRVARVPKELDGGNITQDSARVATSPMMSAPYLELVLRSLETQRFFQRVAKGVAVKGVNISDVRATPIPLPPFAEQERIVDEAERITSVIDQIEATVEVNLKRAESLRQSILRRAFSGRLLSRDAAL